MKLQNLRNIFGLNWVSDFSHISHHWLTEIIRKKSNFHIRVRNCDLIKQIDTFLSNSAKKWIILQSIFKDIQQTCQADKLIELFLSYFLFVPLVFMTFTFVPAGCLSPSYWYFLILFIVLHCQSLVVCSLILLDNHSLQSHNKKSVFIQ